MNHVAARLGEPRHRGTDLIVAQTAPRQVIEGDLAYDAIDKASEDEDVEIFACTQNAWAKLGEARTDGEGHFALVLTGSSRLKPGLYDLYASARADRTGVGFLAYVASERAVVLVTDVDGTLTSSENAVVKQVIFNTNVGVQDGAPEAMRALAASGYQPVYLTARGRGLTQMTRAWLVMHGFPRGPIIMAHGLTLPGNAALRHKKRALAKLRSDGVIATLGVGNRATDVAAYAGAGIPAQHLFVLATQYAKELGPAIDSNDAVPFQRYATLPMLVRK